MDELCNFWHWYPDPRFVLPPPSPLLGSDDLEPISSLSTMALGVVLATTAPADKAICSALGCKSTRLRRDCNHFHCKTHCMELGEGCKSPAHGSRHCAEVHLAICNASHSATTHNFTSYHHRSSVGICHSTTHRQLIIQWSLTCITYGSHLHRAMGN
jgi:hypothetical protein